MNIKIFEQWIMGYLIGEENIEEMTLEELENVKKKAKDIIKFAKRHNLLNLDETK